MKPRLLGVGAPPKWELFNSFKWQGRKGVNSNSCRARWGGWANEWKIENTRIVRGNYSISWIGIFMHKSTRENALASSRRYKLAGCLKQFTQDSPRWFNEKISFENWISSSRFTLTTNIKCDYSRQNFQPWELISILPTLYMCNVSSSKHHKKSISCLIGPKATHSSDTLWTVNDAPLRVWSGFVGAFYACLTLARVIYWEIFDS